MARKMTKSNHENSSRSISEQQQKQPREDEEVLLLVDSVTKQRMTSQRKSSNNSNSSNSGKRIRYSSNPNVGPIDPTVAFLYKPHSISMLVITILGLLYIAFFVVGDDPVMNTKIGVLTCIVLLLLFGVLQFRDGPFIRPHPAFWRMILALSVAYQLILTFILFQNKHDMRQLLTHLDSSLGKPLPEKSYAESCDLTLDNLWNQMDEFVLAHSFGWFAKSLVLRDYWFLWILSVLFEIMEYSLQHQLPNFAECWWDHWILDVLTTNWLGLYLGMKTCEYLQVRHYSWRGINEIKSYRGKMKRSLQQFTPHSWTKFEWAGTKSFKNFLAVIGLLYLELQIELNAFYLKYLLWIPPAHWINIVRLFMVFFMCMPATREAYQYITDPQCKRFGMHAWLATANILTELMICIKFGQGEFPEPAPFEVKAFWTAFVSALMLYSIWQFWWKPRRQRHSFNNRKVYKHYHRIKEGIVNHDNTCHVEDEDDAFEPITPISPRTKTSPSTRSTKTKKDKNHQHTPSLTPSSSPTKKRNAYANKD